MINKRPNIFLPNKLLRDSETINKSLSNLPEQQYSICPFQVILGAINTSESGIRNIGSIPSNYTQFARAFNGKEAVITYWMGSSTITQEKNSIPFTKDNQTGELLENNFWKSLFKVGDVFKGYLTDNKIETIFTPSTFDEETVSLEISETINLTIIRYDKDGKVGWEQNDKFLDNLSNLAYSFFQIPEVFKDTFSVEDDNPNTPSPKQSTQRLYTDENKKYFYIAGANAIINKDTKKIEYVEISFASVNDKVAKSNLADNQYIQNGAPGDSYAFPKINENTGEIELNPIYLEPAPITHAQVGVYGNFYKTSLMFVGRPIRVIRDDNGNIIGKKIFAPRLICPFKYQASEYNNLYNTPLPNTNYFSVINGQPTMNEYFEDWKASIYANYNIPAGKVSEFDGVIDSDDAKTEATNTKTQGTNNKYVSYWDASFGKDDNFYNDKAYNVEGSDLFYTIKPNSSDFNTATGIKTFNPTDLETKSLSNWNLTNFAIFKQFPQLPETISQITPIALSSLPVIGGFLNKITLGLQLGWKSVNNLSQPDAFPIPGLLSCETYLFSVSRSKDKATGLIYCDLLKSGTLDAPDNFVGVNNKFSAFAFNLTDRIQLKPTDIDTANFDSNTIETISTRDLQQYRVLSDGTIDKTKLYALNKTMNTVEANKVGFEDFKVGFVIDKAIVMGGNKSKYDITFFSQPEDISGDIDSRDAVWYGRYLSISNKTGNIRSWINEIPTSNPLWRDDIDPFLYPANVLPPAPDSSNNYEQEYIMTKIQDKVELDAQTVQLLSNVGPQGYQSVKGINGHGNYTFETETVNDFLIPTGYEIASIKLDLLWVDDLYSYFDATFGAPSGDIIKTSGSSTARLVNINKTLNISFNPSTPYTQDIFTADTNKLYPFINSNISKDSAKWVGLQIDDPLKITLRTEVVNKKLKITLNSADNGSTFRVDALGEWGTWTRSTQKQRRIARYQLNSVIATFKKI